MQVTYKERTILMKLNSVDALIQVIKYRFYILIKQEKWSQFLNKT